MKPIVDLQCSDVQCRIGLVNVLWVLIMCLHSGCEVEVDGSSPVAASRAVLIGETSHSFGEIEWNGISTMEVIHTFRLTNQGRSAIEIIDVRGTCRCVAGQASRSQIVPGEEVEIPIHLKISMAGRIHERLWVLFDDGTGSHKTEIEVRANVHRAQDFWATHRAIDLITNSTGIVTLIVTGWANDSAPPEPELRAPGAIEATFLGWKRVRIGRDEDWHLRWQGAIELLRIADQLQPDDKTLRIQLLQAPEIKVDLTGWPW